MLEGILNSRVGTRMLMRIGRAPYEEVYLNQLSRELCVGLGRAQELLNSLAAAGVLSKARSGNRLMYKLNGESPLALEVIRLASLDAMLGLPKRYQTAAGELLRKSKDALGSNLSAFIVYGSVARGAAKKGSDIDILIIASAAPEKNALEKLQDGFRDVGDAFAESPEEHVMSEAAFRENYELGDDFVINVLRDGIIAYDGRDYYKGFLLHGIPPVSRESIRKRLEAAKKWLDASLDAFRDRPQAATSLMGVVSIHLSRAALLLKGAQPGSRHDIPGQLKGIGEAKFARVYKTTRSWEDNPPMDIGKDELWSYLSFLKEKYFELSRLVAGWTWTTPARHTGEG